MPKRTIKEQQELARKGKELYRFLRDRRYSASSWEEWDADKELHKRTGRVKTCTFKQDIDGVYRQIDDTYSTIAPGYCGK